MWCKDNDRTVPLTSQHITRSAPYALIDEIFGEPHHMAKGTK